MYASLFFEEAFDKEHVYTAASYHNISRAYMSKKNYFKAKYYSLMAKEIKEKKYPAENPSLLSTNEI